MTEDEARKILGDSIEKDGRLSDVGECYVKWSPSDKWAVLDGNYFTPEIIEAIAWWMKNKGTPT